MLTLQSLRSQMGLVPQDFFFHDTIYNNLLPGWEETSYPGRYGSCLPSCSDPRNHRWFTTGLPNHRCLFAFYLSIANKIATDAEGESWHCVTGSCVPEADITMLYSTSNWPVSCDASCQRCRPRHCQRVLGLIDKSSYRKPNGLNKPLRVAKMVGCTIENYCNNTLHFNA